MKKVIKQWLAFGFVMGAFASCSQDRNEPSPSAKVGGEDVVLGLHAEVSVDDSEMRALNYKLGKNSLGKLVPMPQFENGQLVDVHTIIKSNRNASVVKTLKWRYDSGSKRLQLLPVVRDAQNREYKNDITIADFNADSGTKWYISGMIGGALDANNKTVSIEGVRQLNGVVGTEGNIVGSLDVPYAFGWTELKIDTKSAKTGTSYQSAQLPSNSNVRFSPLGSLIGYKLGNEQNAGAYTFTPSEFVVNSNAFGDSGTFNLNTNLPTTSTQTILPTWKESAADVSLVYGFSSGQTPGVIAHRQVSQKTYYAWAMPHATQPRVASVNVTVRGTSSDASKREYKVWATDYETKGNQLDAGRMYSLRANVTSGRPIMPLDLVADYNLAGGDGLTYTHRSGPASGLHLSREYTGIYGPLRFAGTHHNNSSGYYNWYTVTGTRHDKYNPNQLRLQDAMDAAFGPNQYYIPSIEEWWGIFPFGQFNWWAENPGSISMTNRHQTDYPNQDELAAFNVGGSLLRQSYTSHYKIAPIETANISSGPFGMTSSPERLASTIYAIRFEARKSQTPLTATHFDQASGQEKSNSYPSAPNNQFRTAYRYIRGRNEKVWSPSSTDIDRYYTAVRVEMVYLGDQPSVTIETISNNEFWAQKQRQGLVVTKVFSAPEAFHYQEATQGVSAGSQGLSGDSDNYPTTTFGWYTSTTLLRKNVPAYAKFHSSAISGDGYIYSQGQFIGGTGGTAGGSPLLIGYLDPQEIPGYRGLPVRPFKRNP